MNVQYLFIWIPLKKTIPEALKKEREWTPKLEASSLPG